MKVVKFYPGERTSIADQIFAACDTPRNVQGDVSAILVAGSASRVLRGFNASFANNQVTVAGGAALLAFNVGEGTQKGLYVGDDAPDQSFDCAKLAPGTYGVFVTFNSVPSDLGERTRYQGGSTGFDQDLDVYTRQAAHFSLEVAASAPGDQYLKVASVSLPDGAVADTRPLLFEGDASKDFAPAWGSDADRSAERGANPISDLETMIAALKVAIEDVKGTPWYEAASGGGGNGGDGNGGGSGSSGGGISNPDGASYKYDSSSGSFAWLGSGGNPFLTLSETGLVLHVGSLSFPDGTSMATAASGQGDLPADGSANSLTIEPGPAGGSSSGLFVRNAAGTVVFSVDTDGNTTMLGTLNVGRLATFQTINAANLNIDSIVATGNTQLQGMLTVTGDSKVGNLAGKAATFTSIKATNSDLGTALAGSLNVAGTATVGALEGHTATLDGLSVKALEVGDASTPGSAKVRGTLEVTGLTSLADLDAKDIAGANVTAAHLGVDGAVLAASLEIEVGADTGSAKPLLVARADGTELVSADQDGNFHILGTLVVAGAQTNDATNAGALTATSFVNSGNSRLQGSLTVEAATTLADVTGGDASFASLASTGTLSAAGATTLTDLTAGATEVSTLLAQGLATLKKGLAVTGATALGSLTAQDGTFTSVSAAGAGSFGSLSSAGPASVGGLSATDVHATGNLLVDGKLTLGGAATIGGAATVGGLLTGKLLSILPGSPAATDSVVSVAIADGTSLLNLDGEGNLVIRGGLKVNGGDESDNVTNAGALTATSFNDSGVANIQGDTTLGANLSVAGDTVLHGLTAQAIAGTTLSLSDALTVAGAALLKNGLQVSGNTATGSLSTLGITVSKDQFGNAGNMSVAGITSLGETHTGFLGASSILSGGSITANGTLVAQADAVVKGGLSVAGGSALHSLSATDITGSTLASTGATQVGGDLSVAGAIKGVTLSLALPASNPPALPILLRDGSGNTLFSADSQGDVVIAGTLTLTGNQTGSANNLGAVTVTSLSDLGNAAIQGTLSVNGATTLGQLTASATTLGTTTTQGLTATTVAATGAVTLQAALSVAGTSTLGAVNAQALTAASAQISGAAQVGTTFRVLGATTLAQTSTGALTAASLNCTANASVGGTLTVAGGTTLAALGLSGTATFGGALNVSGATTLSSLAVSLPASGASATPVTVAKNDGTSLLSLDASGNLTIPGKITAAGGVVSPSQGDITVTSLTDTGPATIQGALSVGGASTLAAVTATSVTASGGLQGASLAVLLPSSNAAANPFYLANSAGSKLFSVDGSGNALVSGTLGVAGQLSGSTITTSGLASLNSLSVANNASVGNNLSVSGGASAASLSLSGSASVGGTTTSGYFRSTAAGSVSNPILGYSGTFTGGNVLTTGVYSDSLFGQWYETVGGYNARSITYSNGTPRDYGVNWVTHNAYTGVSGAIAAHRWYVNGSSLALQILGNASASFASALGVGGLLTSAGVTLSSGALTFADGTALTSAKVQAQPSYISTQAGTAALPAFQFAGGTNPSGVFFDSAPGNVLVSVNGYKSLYSTAASGAAAGANGWAIASTLGSGSALLALFGSGTTSTPIFAVDGVGATTAAGLLKSAGLTLTSGALTFADGTSMTTAATGSGSGSGSGSSSGGGLIRPSVGPPTTTNPAVQNDGDYVIADQVALYGPRANGTFPANPQSLIGPTGPAGFTSLPNATLVPGPTVLINNLTASSTTQVIPVPGSTNVPQSYFPMGPSALMGVGWFTSGVAITAELYDLSANKSIYTVSIPANSYNNTGVFTTTQYPMVAGNQHVWRFTGSGSVSANIQPFYLSASSTNTPALSTIGGFMTAAGTAFTSTAIDIVSFGQTSAKQRNVVFVRAASLVGLVGTYVPSAAGAAAASVTITVGVYNYSTGTATSLFTTGTLPNSGTPSVLGSYQPGTYTFPANTLLYMRVQGSGTGQVNVDAQMVI